MKMIRSALLAAWACIGLAASAQSTAPPAGASQKTALDADARTIDIVSGTYGQNCGARRGNATHDLARRCDGRLTCDYILNRTFGAGAASCRRGFLAEWRCSNTEFHTAALSAGAKSGDVLVLSCERQDGPGR
ncbi:hypothetical protein ACV229_01295 [Burkholderia sp. MR1-5-21]